MQRTIRTHLEGHQHLGDEPSVCGDVAYSGIALEFPLTLRPDPAGTDTTTLVLRTKEVQTFAGYPGHLITVTSYELDPSDPHARHRNRPANPPGRAPTPTTAEATARLTSLDDHRKELVLDLAGIASPPSSAFASGWTPVCRRPLRRLLGHQTAEPVGRFDVRRVIRLPCLIHRRPARARYVSSSSQMRSRPGRCSAQPLSFPHTRSILRSAG